mmetsp:Transcript_39131/g.100214  ORF Transcript_39131/g.100214 Transcript_39131/m.100214 type:complete len:352 (-) Transcript_39131:602-1657(-)
MPVIHEEPLTKKYIAGVVSFPALSQYLYYIGCICLTYYLTYATHGMWLKEATFVEQPSVEFKHSYIAEVEGATAAGGAFRAVFSTLAGYNQYQSPADVRVPSFRIAPKDINNDMKADEFDVYMSWLLPAGQTVNQVRILLPFSYLLSDNAVYASMEANAFFEASSPASSTAVTAAGDLSLRQRFPFPASYYRRPLTVKFSNGETVSSGVPSSSPSPLTSMTFTSGEQTEWGSLLSTLTSYNETAAFEPSFVTWARSASTSGGSTPFTTAQQQQINGAYTSNFELKLTVRIPYQVVRYTPGTIEVLKFAWVQFLALFLVVTFIASWLRNFLFRERIFLCRVRYPLIPREKMM